MGHLGEAYFQVGELDKAVRLLEQTLERMKSKRGPEHPDMLNCMAYLAAAYQDAGEPGKALSLLKQAVLRYRARFGRRSPLYGYSLALLGSGLLKQHAFAVAEPALRECAVLRQSLQPGAWTTFNTLSLLGGSLLGQQRYAEAEPLLLAGYQGMRARQGNIPVAGRVQLPEAVDRLIALYAALEQPDQVEKWRAERAKYPSLKEKK